MVKIAKAMGDIFTAMGGLFTAYDGVSVTPQARYASLTRMIDDGPARDRQNFERDMTRAIWTAYEQRPGRHAKR